MNEVPLGFKFSGISCGIKEKRKKDLGLIYAWEPCLAAGFFTQNKLKAHPVLIDIKRIKNGKAQAILVNSGCANALNGKEGREDALEISRRLSSLLGVEEKQILLASTGVIGKRLPKEKILEALPLLVEKLSPYNLEDFAQSILTTDTFVKVFSLTTPISGRGKKMVKITGIAKGAGMISPQLATMLVFLLTDACIKEEALKEALREAVDNSFHNLLVDGDMSTNDTVLILASGLARNPRIKPDSENYPLFLSSLTQVCQELAKMIARDGEGSTKLIEIRVKGAWDRKDARRIARAIARSPLVKTAIYGEDPYWGRILAAIGSTRVKFKPERLELSIQGITIFKNLSPLPVEKELKEKLKDKEIIIEVNLNHGPHSLTFWSCDLTEEYVRINAHYHT